MGYLNDDWYLMYDAQVRGADVFGQVFASDRPLRAFVMAPAFTLFGLNPLPYHLSAYAFRLIAGLAVLWLARQLWPKRPDFSLLSALLFLIYPGFLSQINAIDYLSHLVSLAAITLSIAFTLAALKTSASAQKWSFSALAVLLGWVSYGLMEYFIGFEGLRLASAALYFWQDDANGPLRRKVVSLTRAILPFWLAPLGFLSWRLFLFSPERRATDTSSQLGALLSSPLITGGWWLVYLIQDSLNTIFLAWAVPPYTLAFTLRLRDSLLGLGLAFGLGLFSWFIFAKLIPSLSQPDISLPSQPLWVGLFSVLVGLIPILFANRHVEFANYSRYTIPGMVGAALVMAALIFALPRGHLRHIGLALLVGLGALTHHANAVNAVANQKVIQTFWWQVSWRIPQIQPGTLLTAMHPGFGIQEDYFIWGPANLIYAPQKQTGPQVKISLPAAILTDENTLKMLTGQGREETERRGNLSIREYDTLLVLTLPNLSACVRVIDGSAPELSTLDDNRIRLVASNSNLQNVLPDGSHQTPPAVIFGPEPIHDWCYYYQKAALARQQGDFAQVAALGDEALQLGYYPGDRVEWLPFLQAYASLERQPNVRQIIRILREDAYLTQQTCQNAQAWELSAPMRSLFDELLCQN